MSLQSQTILKHMVDTGMPPAMVEGLRASITKVDAVMADFHLESNRLKKDGDFSQTGRKNRTAEAAVDAARRLSEIEHAGRGYGDNIAQIQESMKPSTRKGDAVLLFMQEQEVRARLVDLDPLLLQVKYTEACAEGGRGADLVCAAVENDPMPRLSEEIIQEGIAIRGQRTSPAEAEKMRQIIRLQDGLRSALAEARAELVDSGLPEDDWLMKMAEGEI